MATAIRARVGRIVRFVDIWQVPSYGGLFRDEVKGYLFAYDRLGYPDVLKPHSVEFVVLAAKGS